VSAELGDDLVGSIAGFVAAVGREGDGADAGMSSAAVALTDGGEVEHFFRMGFGPGIGADGDLGPEAGFRQADGVGGLGVNVVGDELVVSLHGLIADVEVDGAVFRFGAVADEAEGFFVALEERREERGDEGLPEDIGERHRRQQRDETRDEGGVLARFDDQGELHGGLGHFDGGLRALVEGSVDDVGPADKLGDRLGVETKFCGRDVGEEAGAGNVRRVVEAAVDVTAVCHAAAVVFLILGGEESAEVMVEPPGNPWRGGVLEVDDGVLVAGEVGFVEEGSGAVDEAVVGVGSVFCNALAVKAGEEGRGAGSVKTLVVVEDSDVQKVGCSGGNNFQIGK
jgi:hypothetical protein